MIEFPLPISARRPSLFDRIIVCGGQAYDDVEMIDFVLGTINPLTIIQGGAPGADQLAREWAALFRRDVITFEADWKRHRMRAGPIRNAKMLEVGRPDLVVAFPGGKGTDDMVDRAVKALGVSVFIVASAKY